jgi:hypothetical protein
MPLPLPPHGAGGFEPGALIEHRRFDDGEEMTVVRGRTPSFAFCDAPAGGRTDRLS